MTRYAIDLSRRALLATWSTGLGDVAITVAALPDGASEQDTLHLAHTLTLLSGICWRCYTHPASAEPNPAGELRQEERDAFATVVPALTSPNLPVDGYLTQSGVLIEETAHRVGRALHVLRDPDLTALVASDVAADLAAIEQAELGNLSDRARQAVALSREDASPVQVAQADTVLHDNPFGSDSLFTEIDPAAAAVAAAHWLYAAATVTAEGADVHPAQIVIEADNIEALPHATPTKVLELMSAGASPRQAVMPLIRDALRVAEGEIASASDLQRRIAAAERLIERWRAHSPELSIDSVGLRLTTLDPARPALDLLEDLLSGIRGCWLLYHEHAIDVREHHPDEGDDVIEDRLIEAFFAEVRLEAAAQRDRLL